MFDTTDLLRRLMTLPLLIISLSVHEWAHAYSAYKLGDDTASRAGRLTLNPLAHIDPVGTLLLPLLGVPFGWAKPVPVNPVRFRRDISMKTGMMITAAAGPASNVLIALVCTVGFGLVLRVAPNLLVPGRSMLFEFVTIMVLMNVSLALFNMLPIPPLDGSRVVDGLMPYRLRPQWEQYARFAPFVLLAIIVFGRNLLSGPIWYLFELFRDLMWFAAGVPT